MKSSRIKDEKIVKRNYAVEIKYKRTGWASYGNDELDIVYRIVIAESLEKIQNMVNEILKNANAKLISYSGIYIKEEIITFTHTNEIIKYERKVK